MPVPGYISNDTTNLSNVSLYGGNLLASRVSSSGSIVGSEAWFSGVSVGSIVSTSRLSSSATIYGKDIWGSGLSIGNSTAGGTLIPAISSTSSLVAAFVVQGSASSFTRITWAAAQPGDIILTSPFPDAAQSSISSGLVVHSHCTVAGFIEMRLSNVSTLVQNQSSKSFVFIRISPF